MLFEPNRLNYRHAIITGGSSGIGKAIARKLIQEGTNLSLIARTESKLAAAKAELIALKAPQNGDACPLNPPNSGDSLPQSWGQGGKSQILTISADVSDRHQIEKAIQTAIAHFGAPALLITAAGMAHPGYFKELPLDIFEETMAVNYFGSLYCVKAVLPAMEQQNFGHIALISSGVGLIGLFGYTPYSASKFALRGLAESLRGELKAMGIGLSIAYPPDTDTPQLAAENRFKPPETYIKF
ncbi:MAG: SDR family oxidoreductase [Moorea sp. SIO2B7]|nr:SDR family oxidoreductase [Moorena sp. SIO2B7]